MAQMVKNLRAMQELQETQIRSLGQEDPLEKEMATHSSILAWKIPWTEEPGQLRPWGCKESDKTEWLTLSLLESLVSYRTKFRRGKRGEWLPRGSSRNSSANNSVTSCSDHHLCLNFPSLPNIFPELHPKPPGLSCVHFFSYIPSASTSVQVSRQLLYFLYVVLPSANHAVVKSRVPAF